MPVYYTNNLEKKDTANSQTRSLLGPYSNTNTTSDDAMTSTRPRPRCRS